MKKFISLLLVCLMVVPFGMLAGVSVNAAEPVVYLGDAGDDANDGTTAAKAVKTFAKAEEKLGANGGIIKITGTFTQGANITTTCKKLTIMGDNADAKFLVTGAFRFILGGEVTFDAIHIETQNTWVVVCHFNNFTATGSIKFTRAAGKSTYLVAGNQDNSGVYTPKDVTLNVFGGEWVELVGTFRNSHYSSTAKTETADFLKDYDITINIAEKAVVYKVFAYLRQISSNITPFSPTNATCTLNLNGGKVVNFIGLHDMKGAANGYDSFVINVGAGFDWANSFKTNRLTDSMIDSSGVFQGISGESVWEDSKITATTTVGKTKVVLAESIYDTVKNDPGIRAGTLTIEKAAATPPAGGSTTNKITLPAEPVATSTKVVYVAYAEAYKTANVADYTAANKVTSATTNAGTSIDDVFKNSAFSSWVALFEDNAGSALGAQGALKDGGTMLIAGKALAGLGTNWNYRGVIPATTTPIVITGKDPVSGTSYISLNADGTICYMSDTGANLGQYGMFMMEAGTTTQSNTLVFQGDVIFKDVVILNRTNVAGVTAGNLAPTISVEGKLVIDSSVQFASMSGGAKYVLNVAEGGYAYLHKLGFGSYTGTGVIVIGDEILDEITEEMFAGFEGKLVDEDGYEIDFDADDDQGGNNPDTSDKTWALAVVAAIAVMGCAVVVASKKRA